MYLMRLFNNFKCDFFLSLIFYFGSNQTLCAGQKVKKVEGEKREGSSFHHLGGVCVSPEEGMKVLFCSGKVSNNEK